MSDQLSIPGMPDDDNSPAAMVKRSHARLREQHRTQGLAFQWGLTNHVCRACFGRVLARESVDGKRFYRCSNCGAEREGADERAICSCGIKLRNGKDAGIRCHVNEAQTSEFPGEIVAAQQQGVPQ